MPHVYILANGRNGTLYIGVTNNLARRIEEHRERLVESFTKKYDVKRLVYVEEVENIASAILREKQLKKWNRSWKMRIIEEQNPTWDDLADRL